MTIFDIFYELLSIQNVNVDRFVRNVECDFFEDFQTLCAEHAKVKIFSEIQIIFIIIKSVF